MILPSFTTAMETPGIWLRFISARMASSSLSAKEEAGKAKARDSSRRVGRMNAIP
jgi:hypothetical protein